MFHRIKSWVNAINQSGVCIYCLSNTERDPSICDSCISELPWIRQACSRCALPLLQAGICGECLSKPPSFHSAKALFEFVRPLDRFIYGLKFNQRFEILSFIAKEMATHFYSGGVIDCLLPVPLHRERLKTRGYNQSMEIAKIISQQIGVPIDWQLVQKVKNTQSQTSMGAKARRVNLKNAFKVQGNVMPQNIVIIDDVLTTGATVNSLSSVLLKAGVKKIEVWCCCRTPKK